MSDGDALLAAILADPADDTARLVYADWLTENGQADRAEFIRVQVELARLRTPKLNPGDVCKKCVWGKRRCKWHRLYARSCELADGSRYGWERRYGTPSWSRGFVSSVITSWSDWLSSHTAILAAHPVRTVALTHYIGFGLGYREPAEFVTYNRNQYVIRCGLAGEGQKVHTFREDQGEIEDYRTLVLGEEWPGIKFEIPAQDNRLIATWRGRTVQVGQVQQPENWFMSAVQNQDDFA